ncbi:MAG: phenylalanine--tRNA ligase subunit beta [Rhodothermia bacterium]|nr:MAG: phenylalanine--tRNA ligase subunit beta [Rhodothermia bacterium]
MKISANWLSDYVDHGLSIEELSDRLTMAGLEVEYAEKIGARLEGIIVGHVLEVSSHPNADRLTLCTVDVGDGDPLSIVCGAPNVVAGQKVAVAPIGTTLRLRSRKNNGAREEVTIKTSKIRGEVSHGMICAEDELGLSDDHEGIMVLDESAIVGSALEESLSDKKIPAADAVIDIAITPNRPDAVSHIGVARDVAAFSGKELKSPSVTHSLEGTEATTDFSVQIDAPQGCPTYAAILVKGIDIRESPAWIQQRLSAIGLRPRNNVVDITNYVMYELGQPLHAFDFDQLAGAQIIVRETSAESTFTTLDDVERELPAGTLMIADGDRDVAIAGVMGGQNSEVTTDTKNVLIESAYFNPAQIRRTARALQLQTDASYRFERGVDPTGQLRAAARAAELMAELSGGEIVDDFVVANPLPYEPRFAILRPERVGHVLGLSVPNDRIQTLLTSIGFNLSDENGALKCEIPPFRPDVEREIDIIEEIARLVGYDAIPEPPRSAIPNHPVVISPQRQLREQASDLLSSLGFKEVVTNSMLSRDAAEAFCDPILPGARFGGDVVDTLNSVSREMATLRPSVLPGVIRVAAHNQNRGKTSLKYFEFGNTQMRVQTEHSILENYTERECLLVLSSGQHGSPGWDSAARSEDVFDVKGIAEAVIASVHLPAIRFAPVYEASKISTHYIDIYSGEEKLGVLGQLAGSVAKTFDLRGDVFFFELDWSSISELAAPFLRKHYDAFSRHPVVDRDIAVTVSRTEAVGPMIDSIQSAGGDLLKRVSVFDLYAGDQIDANLKSVAFAMTFAADRTLRDEEVDKEVNQIISLLEKNHGAKLRQ